jgi:hypothetical protein
MNVELTKMAELGFFRSFYTLKKKILCKNVGLFRRKFFIVDIVLITSNF